MFYSISVCMTRPSSNTLQVNPIARVQRGRQWYNFNKYNPRAYAILPQTISVQWWSWCFFNSGWYIQYHKTRIFSDTRKQFATHFTLQVWSIAHENGAHCIKFNLAIVTAIVAEAVFQYIDTDLAKHCTNGDTQQFQDIQTMCMGQT